MTDEKEVVERQFPALLFGVRRSIRYHTKRRMHYERLETWGNFLGVIFGSATILAVLGRLGPPWIAIAAAALVTVTSAINLVVGSSRKARLHLDLARRFIALEKQLVATADPDLDQVARLTGERLEIEAAEPPPLRVLDTICHNELLHAMGYTEEEAPRKRVTGPQRLLSQIYDFRGDRVTRPLPPQPRNA